MPEANSACTSLRHIGSVSYTHLDVYKRPTLNGAVFGEKNGQTFTLTHEYTGMSANVPYTVCGVIKAVSYTHLESGTNL